MLLNKKELIEEIRVAQGAGSTLPNKIELNDKITTMECGCERKKNEPNFFLLVREKSLVCSKCENKIV